MDEEALFLAASEAGAEDFEATDEAYIITTAPEMLYEVKESLDKLSIESDASLEMIPKIYVDCDEETIQANQALIDWLEELDDVDEIYHNMQQN